MAPLTIYKASAGSGKTFTLTREYIKLLFEKPGQHRRILAVTFTNKATSEMKARILHDLYKLSTGQNHPLNQALCEDLGISSPSIQLKALGLLHEILHDYSHFSILTIDSFFQRVVRSFARELGLHASYEVAIEQTDVISHSIDDLLHSMEEHPELKEWLIRLAINKMQEGKSWDFHMDLSELGKELSREEFQRNPEATLLNISDKKLLKSFEESLRTLISDFETRLLLLGKSCRNIMETHGLSVDDFSGKSKGVAGYLQKTAIGTVSPPGSAAQKAYDNPDKWYTKSSPSREAIQTIFPELNSCLGLIIDLWEQKGTTFRSAASVLKKLHLMGALSELALSIGKYTRDHNLFLLSDTAQLLNKIISDADAPFVYEKTGSFFEHFMIDEFQDTSETQWGNFRPLITNSMASGNENWVVGDVKQSIYRFRNTDWRILGQKLEAEMPRHSSQTKSLQYNWRSDGVIIQFNNTFFAQATNIMSGWFENTNMEDTETSNTVGAQMSHDIRQAYADSCQYLPEPRKERADKGHVEVRFLPSDSEDSWKEQSLHNLPKDVESLQNLGYRAQDIAILVRTRAEAHDVAQVMLSYKRDHPESTAVFDVLSNESLSLVSSSAVQFMITIMRCLENPENPIHQAYLEHEYRRYIQPFCSFHDASDKINSIEKTLYSDQAHSPGAAIKIFALEWRNTPVYELTEKLLKHFGLHALRYEQAYIQAFLDTTLQYSRRESTDLQSFLAWWDEHVETQNLIMPEGQNALRLMTIHKSKGLEFKAVIIPLCDWDIKPKNSKILWCRNDQSPFHQLELVALGYNKELNNTIFQKEYLEEKFMSYMDSLNMLYVAFTRAQHTLYVTAPVPNTTDTPSIPKLVHQAVTQTLGWDASGNRFQSGNQCPVSTSPFVSDNPSLASQPFTSGNKIPTHLTHNTQWFSVGTPGDSPLHLGRILHEIFSRIDHTDSLDPILTQLEQEGMISPSQREHVAQTVKNAWKDKKVREWFDNQQLIKNEASVLLPDGSVCRPDRVLLKGSEAIVIDYKFGKKTSSSHQVQVRTYMNYLHSMGYSSVKGYLWYVLLEKTEEVIS